MTYANLKGMPICIKHKKIYLADATMQERIWLGGGGGAARSVLVRKHNITSRLRTQYNAQQLIGVTLSTKHSKVGYLRERNPHLRCVT